MAKFGSELRSEPEPDRTRPYFGVRVRVVDMDRTNGSGYGLANPRTPRTRSERVRT